MIFLFRFLANFPGFDELPVDVDGVVQVEDEAFAAIEEAQADEVVVEEGGGGVGDGVPEECWPGAAGAATGGEELGDL